MFRNKLNMPRAGSGIVRRKKVEEKLREPPKRTKPKMENSGIEWDR
ncbi:hypothetical protein CEB3_c50230 [Peptococcaceae bacterium CEB3]|nr:hypothetical protein CEB3_c50230 [Peptococcaceae bacterium CEB3]